MVNAMTVDVEEYFQVSAFAEVISPQSWADRESRVVHSVELILEIFSNAGIAATFFVLGWVAERYPGLIKAISNAGHEIASHGYGHRQLTRQTIEQFRQDVTRAKAVLEGINGKPVLGYRAPSFSLSIDNPWAHEVLNDCGYEYSCSIYPVYHDLYGSPYAPRTPFRSSSERILEIPMSTLRFCGYNVPSGGGGLFRLLPYCISRSMIERINRAEQRPGIFYFHPWELDPSQPRIESASLRSRVRHYINLDKTLPRLLRLLEDFRWGTMEQVFGPFDEVALERHSASVAQ